LLNLPLPQGAVDQPGPDEAGFSFAAARRCSRRYAVIAVLTEAGEPLRTAEIYERVVKRLGVPVTYGNVKDFLGARSHPPRQLFERVGWGRCRVGEDVSIDGLWPRVCGRRTRSGGVAG
jgi:hypothetical protein